MKQIVAILFALGAIASCSPIDNVELESLRVENAMLRAKVDSLEMMAATQRLLTATKPLSKKGEKKSKQALGLVSNVSASLAPQPVYKTSSRSSISYSSQCQAITKKGYQCSRRSRSGGYCWQHGG